MPNTRIPFIVNDLVKEKPWISKICYCGFFIKICAKNIWSSDNYRLLFDCVNAIIYLDFKFYSFVINVASMEGMAALDDQTRNFSLFFEKTRYVFLASYFISFMKSATST